MHLSCGKIGQSLHLIRITDLLGGDLGEQDPHQKVESVVLRFFFLILPLFHLKRMRKRSGHLQHLYFHAEEDHVMLSPFDEDDTYYSTR